MQKKYLEAGRVTSTHGVAGEMRVEPWCDGVDFLKKFKRFYIDEREYKVVSIRAHKDAALVKLEGIETVESAMLYKNKIVFIDRADVRLAPGQRFIQDMLGLPVYDRRTGGVIGKLADIRELPSNNQLIVELPDGREAMIPDVPAFVKDKSGSMIIVETIEGLLDI